LVASGVSSQSFQFDMADVVGNFVLDGRSSLTMDSILSSAANFTASGESDMLFAFVMTTDGNYLWIEIDASTTPENWTEITHSGDSWTEINASGTIETWTNMVV